MAGLALVFGCAMGGQETKKSEAQSAQDQAKKSLQSAADSQKKATDEQAKAEQAQQEVTQKQKELADAQVKLRGQRMKAEQAQSDAQAAAKSAQQEALQQQQQASQLQKTQAQEMKQTESGAGPELDAGAERAGHAGLGAERPAADPHLGPGAAEAPDHRRHRGQAERRELVRFAAEAGQRRPGQLPDGGRQGEGAHHRGYLEELRGAAAEVADSSSLITAPPFITKGTRSRTRTSCKGSPGTAIRSA